MASGTSYTTLLQERRNRILAGFYKENPRERIPDGSNTIYLQIKAGRVPIHRITAGGESITIEPCGCAAPELPSEPIIVGGIVEKDMDNENYTFEFDPNSFQADFFPGMADFVDGNIEAGDKADEDRLLASYWDDLGDDVFDDWGFFYLYDTTSGKYYFPLISPQNQADGVITTQVFNAFGRTFTIKHGWAAQGIFKFDISVADALPFRFGAYGNMGSDGDEFTENLTHPFTKGAVSTTLYYHRHQEAGDEEEQLYSYWIPKKASENNSQTYNAYYDSDNMSMVSKVVTTGLRVYFAKQYDTRAWVINDLASFT